MDCQSTNWKWEKHPVVKIDFNGIGYENSERLKEGLLSTLKRTGEQNNISVQETLLSEKFKETILNLEKNISNQ